MNEHQENIAISVQGVSKKFKLPHEKQSSLKGAFLSIFRGKSFEMQEALKDINFEVKKGEFFGIVGRNGCGKSTLLKCMAGVYTPNKGHIQINGSLVPFIELGVGFNPELSGRDNVYLNGALIGFNRKQMDEMYEEIVEFAELEDFMDQKLKNYSSGMQVRLAFSIAIRAKSDILLLDEVLAVGDASFQQKCFDYFDQLKREQRTIILVTHAMDAVKRFCSQALLMEAGEIKLLGSPEEIADQYLLDNITHKPKGRKTKEQTVAKNTQNFTEYVSKLGIRRLSKKSVDSSEKLRLQFTYKLNKKVSPALAFTIAKDGMSVAEMNSTSMVLPDSVDKEHTVNIETTLHAFNAGVYKIDLALVDRDTRKLLAYRLKADEFMIKGKDDTRGGAIRLDATWEAEKS